MNRRPLSTGGRTRRKGPFVQVLRVSDGSVLAERLLLSSQPLERE